MDRSSSTHSYATVRSVASMTNNTPHRDSLKQPSSHPSFSPSSKLGSVNLRDEISPTYTPSRSRPSTGNSNSSRLWQSPTMYGIPDDDGNADDGDISAHWEHPHRSHTLSGSSPSTAGTSRLSPKSSLVDMASRGHANSISGQNPSTRTTARPSTMSSLPEIRPSMSNSSNNSLGELTSLGMDFLSSSPPRILRHLPTPQRTTTMGSSQSTDLNVYAIQNAIDSPQSILHATSGNVSCGTMEGLVQFLIDRFGE
jgi:hypothetical protein